ncbi:MAG: hypothetical protein ABII09_11800, partial [Planctomycetota bacterium]
MENAELAYLLGMITGKGTIIRDNNQTEVIIEIPHKNLISEGMDAKLSVKASLDDIRNILEPLIGARIISSQIANYTPTHCQDRKQAYLRWIHRRLLKQLGRREPEGRPEYQLLRRIPRLGC